MKKYQFILLVGIALLFSTCKKKEENIKTKTESSILNNNLDTKKQDSISKVDSITVVKENKIDKENEPKITKQEVPKIKNKVINKKPISKQVNETEKEVAPTVQPNAIVNNQTFTKAPIYPGCEEQAKISNYDAMSCLSYKISNDLKNNLQRFANNAAKNNIYGLISTKLNFTIDTNGKITNISSEGDKDLGDASKKSFEKLIDRLQKENKLIIPALDQNNNKVEVKYTIPIKIKIE
ncbi:hypothetical protein [Empedobacter brevis]|uniref:hypothetical protein n=1 Tax=Empedobacter brevis TaxID=247 RepID=UPI0039AFCC09